MNHFLHTNISIFPKKRLILPQDSLLPCWSSSEGAALPSLRSFGIYYSSLKFANRMILIRRKGVAKCMDGVGG
jgi:hypothetical protein